MNKNVKRGVLLATAGTFLWALSGSVGQYMFENTSMTAEWFVSMRMIIAGVIMTLSGFLKNRKESLKIFNDKRDRKSLLAFSILGIWFCQYTFYVAIAYSDSGTASVLQSLSRVFILLGICIQLKRLPERKEVLAVIGAVIGTLCLSVSNGSIALESKGIIFGLLSAIGSYFYNTMPANLINKYGSYQIVGYASLFGGSLFALFAKPWSLQVELTAEIAAVFIIVTIMGTVLAPSMYLKGIALLGPLKGSMIGNTQPIFAVLIAVFFLNTPFRFTDIVGFCLILSSIMVLSVGKVSKKDVS